MKPIPHPADQLAWRLGPTRGDSLVLLLHGVGASASDLEPVAQALCAADPGRVCVLLNGPAPFDGGGSGRQWFALAGVTPDNRAARVAGALPSLIARLTALTKAEAVTPGSLTLLGFSQGAILTLGLAAAGHPFGQGIAFSGRLAGPIQPPSNASPRLWLSHGSADSVVPFAEGLDAAGRLTEAGYDAAFTAVEGLGHTITAGQIQAAAAWLSKPS